jgi:alkaline phosphatase D
MSQKIDRLLEQDNVKDIALKDNLAIETQFDQRFKKQDMLQQQDYLKDLKKAESHFKVYLRENLPLDYHLAKTPRAGDMVIIPEAPYSLNKSRLDPKFEAGAHGYDPQTTLTMRAIFYASGPKIKKHFQVKPFRNVNVFPFLAQILQLNVPSKMDGDASILAPAVD